MATGIALTPMSASAAQPDWRIRQETKAAALKWELGYLALSAIDAAQTIDCLNRDICKEGNPLFGKKPATTKLLLAKVGLGAIQFAAFSYANERNPKTALRLAQVTCLVQGGVVMLNARFTFK
jgi:hypothetical protein